MFDHLTIGEFYANVRQHQHENWPSVVGRYGIRLGNERGNTLLQFCAINQLTPCNTMYIHKPKRKVT